MLLPSKTLDRVQDVGVRRLSLRRRFQRDADALSIHPNSTLRQNTSSGAPLSFACNTDGEEMNLQKIERPASTCENKACGPPGGLFGIDQEVVTLTWPLRQLRVPITPSTDLRRARKSLITGSV